MDVQRLADGAEAVCGVDVAGVAFVEVEAPVALITRPVLFEAVDIAALRMNDFSEKTLLRHVEGREFEEVVHAVLDHHAVAACPFGGVDQLPALGDALRGGNFQGDVLAVFHGIDGHRDVLQPRGDDVHQVEVVALAELFPALLAAVFIGPGHARLFEYPLVLLDPLGVKVAQRPYFHVVDESQPGDGAGTPHAQSDDADPDHRDRLGGEAQQRLLVWGAFGRVEDDPALFDREFAVVDRLAAECGADQHERQKQE